MVSFKKAAKVMPTYQISEIHSGGQTGVDRAALDIAITFEIPYKGWCPKGRWSEDNSIPDMYTNLKETPTSAPEQRTEWNVRDSDGTLIIINDVPSGGTLYTILMAQKHNKPYFIFELDRQTIEGIISWIENHSISKLNIAGSRESEANGIYLSTYNILLKLLEPLEF
jgi:hypothetical protein